MAEPVPLVDWPELRDALIQLIRDLHDLHLAWRPRWHKNRCGTCNPMMSRPLCVNGREYRRRQLARRRRGN